MKKIKMEKTSNKQEKRKMAIRIGGGGGVVGAVVVLGGALAIATLASVSAIKLRRKPTNKSHPPPIPTDQSNELEKKSSKDEESNGLRSLLQESSPPVLDHQRSDGTTNMGVIQIDSTSLVSTESPILDNDPVPDISGQKEKPTCGDQEILLSDNSKPESGELLIDHGVDGQELLFPVCVSPSLLNPESVNKNEFTEDLLLVEVIEDKKEDEAIAAPNASQIEEEDNCKMQLIEDAQKEEEYDDGENIVEKGEEAVVTAQVDQIAMELDPQMQLCKEEDNNENDVGVENEEEDIAEKGEEVAETAQVDQIAMKHDPQMQLSKEEDNNENDVGVDDEEEDIAEKGEEAAETAAVDQIAMELNPQMQLSKEEDNNETDVGVEEEEEEEEEEEDIAEKGEEAVETIQVDQIAMELNPQMQLSKEEDNNENDVGVEDDEEEEEDIAKKGEEAVETAQVDQIAMELDPQMQLSKEDNIVNDDDDDDDVTEKGEEGSSEGTGDSSMESNADPIWPVESMQELSQAIKELKVENQKLGEEIEEDITPKRAEHDHQNGIESSSNDENIGKSTTSPQVLKLINQPKNSSDSDLRIWIWLMLVLVLVLVVPLLLPLTQIVKLCLIFLFIMILFKFHMFEKLS
ncbi:hypothetical protein F0562_021435 [Nyssa sinensis]|uniref:Uncharacterized protein n=1 Tax=Nyssa sinensis TaxID=561372 RepID=A0A5J5BLH8_9ASTE|nr:hypothetical protein F0562_021435 [Nyssa sinensis]